VRKPGNGFHFAHVMRVDRSLNRKTTGDSDLQR
jgi:hypothetical protein